MDIQAAALIGSGLAMGFGVLGPGLGIGMAVSAAINGTARQPELGNKLLTQMFIGAALIEVLGLLSFLIAIMLVLYGIKAA
ncbi:MAG: ATP synthase F0 subunit C [Candidatus Gastranaerophilaceae bacterium]|jgi:F-type H+-transporting ATPase subunit c